MRPAVLLALVLPAALVAQSPRPRARDAGLVIGSLPAGPLNAITDVAGVAVGQVTLTEGVSVSTGVTVIVPHGGNPLRDRVPAAAIVNSLFRAESVRGARGTVRALPLDSILPVLREHRAIR